MKEKTQKSDIKNILSLGLTSFFNDLASEMIYPLLPAFLAVKLGAGPAGLGLVEGIAETTSSILKYYSGRMSDRIGKRKPIFLFGYIFSNIVRPLMGFASAWWHILVLRFSDRVGKGIRTAPRDALLADSASIKHRSLAFSFHRAMDHTGALFGPIIAWLLMSSFGMDYQEVFLWSAVPGIFVIFTIIFLVKEKPPAVKTETRIVESSARNAGKDTNKDKKQGLNAVAGVKRVIPLEKSFYYYLLIIIVFTLGNSSDAFLLLLAQQKGVALVLLPILWGVFHISKMAFSFLGGWLGDKWSKRGIVTSGWIIYGLVYTGFAFAATTLHIWLLFIAYGVYFGFTEGTEKALVADFVSAKHYGRAYGLYNLAVGIGALPASLIFGLVWQVFSHEAAFILGASLSITAAVLLNILKLKKSDER